MLLRLVYTDARRRVLIAFLKLLANLTCDKAATASLVLGSSLLSWIELQLQDAKAGEGLAWVKIVENILAVMNVARLQTSTAGEWTSIISRCLLRLLETSCKLLASSISVRPGLFMILTSLRQEYLGPRRICASPLVRDIAPSRLGSPRRRFFGKAEQSRDGDNGAASQRDDIHRASRSSPLNIIVADP